MLFLVVGRKRVYQYYLPVFFYVEQQLAQHKDGRQHKDLSPRPLVFGISAPQVWSTRRDCSGLQGLVTT